MKHVYFTPHRVADDVEDIWLGTMDTPKMALIGRFEPLPTQSGFSIRITNVAWVVQTFTGSIKKEVEQKGLDWLIESSTHLIEQNIANLQFMLSSFQEVAHAIGAVTGTVNNMVKRGELTDFTFYGKRFIVRDMRLTAQLLSTF